LEDKEAVDKEEEESKEAQDVEVVKIGLEEVTDLYKLEIDHKVETEDKEEIGDKILIDPKVKVKQR
jgi:hypothetical protein